MNLKQKIRSYNFWVSISSAVLLFLRILGQQIGFNIDANAFMDIFTALCGILVVAGIITMPTTIVDKKPNNKNIKENDEMDEIVNNNSVLEAICNENDVEIQQNEEQICEQNVENNLENVQILLENSQNIENNEQNVEKSTENVDNFSDNVVIKEIIPVNSDTIELNDNEIIETEQIQSLELDESFTPIVNSISEILAGVKDSVKRKAIIDSILNKI